MNHRRCLTWLGQQRGKSMSLHEVDVLGPVANLQRGIAFPAALLFLTASSPSAHLTPAEERVRFVDSSRRCGAPHIKNLSSQLGGRY